jgi:transcriptional regulator with XRE-family HTH domain
MMNMGTHESELFWDRLRIAYNASSHTHETLAEAAGVSRNTVQRLLAGESNSGFVKTLTDMTNALGIPLKTLFDYQAQINHRIGKIGIPSIDQMINEIYNETSVSGCDELANYAHPDYKVFNPSYKKNVSDMYITARERGYLTLDEERLINTQNNTINGGLMQKELLKYYCIPDYLVVIFDCKTILKSDPSIKTSYTVIEHLQLEHPIEYYSNGTEPPKIIKRHWSILDNNSTLVSQ